MPNNSSMRLFPSLWSGRITLALLTAALAGCAASREAQIRTALTNAGLPQPMAQCMAPPLASDLSNDQLRSISRIAKAIDDPNRVRNERDLVELLRRDLDPNTVAVVVRAGVGCYLRG